MTTPLQTGDILQPPLPKKYKYRVKRLLRQPHWDEPVYLLQLWSLKIGGKGMNPDDYDWLHGHDWQQSHNQVMALAQHGWQINRQPAQLSLLNQGATA